MTQPADVPPPELLGRRFLIMTEEIRQPTSDRCSVREITRAASRIGCRSFRHEDKHKVLPRFATIEAIEQNTAFAWAS